MEYIIISVAALLTSSLALFSGFGLGTILVPTFALFFPIPVAVAAAAVVHLANNVFKMFLVGREADWGVVLRFALPAALAAIAGAFLLNLLSGVPSIISYQIGERIQEITLVKVAIGILIMAFALFDLVPRLQRLSFRRKYLPLGGSLSGFVGGLSGSQGALRSAFLAKTGLNTQAFVGTSTVSAFVVDVARLAVYGAGFYATRFSIIREDIWIPVLAATLFAFVGSFLASRFVKKVTITAVQYVVGVLLIIVGAGLVSGLL